MNGDLVREAEILFVFSTVSGGVLTALGWRAWTGRWRGWTRLRNGDLALLALPGGLFLVGIGITVPLHGLWPPLTYATGTLIGLSAVASLLMMFVGPLFGTRWYPGWYHRLPAEEQGVRSPRWVRAERAGGRGRGPGART